MLGIIRYGNIGGWHGLTIIAACAIAIVSILGLIRFSEGRGWAWIAAALAAAASTWWSIQIRGRLVLWETSCDGLTDPAERLFHHCGSQAFVQGIGFAFAMVVAMTILSIEPRHRWQRISVLAAALIGCVLSLISSVNAWIV